MVTQSKKRIPIVLLGLSLLALSCDMDTITLESADRTPPHAIIIFPVDGQSVSGQIAIKARATDNEKVDSVRFYVNQELIGTTETESDDVFEYTWKSNDYEEDEYHYISIVAWDVSGNDYAPFPIRVLADNSDNESPTAFIINPFTGQYVNGIVDIIVEASDNDSIQYVAYYVNNVIQGYVQEPPYSYPWNTYLVQDDLYYSIYVVVRDMSNNVTTVAPVSVIVDNNEEEDVIPPMGSIISPPSGITVSGDVEIIVSAVDNIAMGEVEIFINGDLIITDDEQPYEYTWDTTLEDEDAEHIISVVLIDLAGNETSLNPITVVVDNDPPGDETPPIILIIEPAAGQNISGTVSIEISATDENGIGHIDFFIDGDSVYTDVSYPYNYSWDSETVSDDEDHIIGVMGYDLAGNAAPAPPITVFVDNFDNVYPTGQILSPYAGQTVSGTITIEIAASDNVGVDYVNLSIDGSSRIILDEYPYTYQWDTTNESDDEDHVISAVIADISENFTYISPVSVFVNNDVDDTTPPVAVISYPLSGQTVSGTVMFTVLAEDNYGVDDVEFYIDGESVGTDSSDPYDYEWDTTPLENGSQHTLSAAVTDESGNYTLVQPILVIVSN